MVKKGINFFLIGFILVLAAAAFMNCKPGGFVLGERDLRGETMVYMLNGNGKDYYKLEFNDEGTGGDFEEVGYRFDFPDQEAYNSGNYTDKDWFMNDGSRGVFTYDPETHIVEISFTEAYTEKEGASPPYFAEDYNWVSYRTAALGYTAPPDDKASGTHEIVMCFNNDSPLIYPFIRQGEESSVWKYWQKTEEVTEIGGIKTVEVDETSYTFTITEDQFLYDDTRVETVTVDGGTPDIETDRIKETYTVNGFFLQGEDTTEMEFAEVWKEGNKVTFLVEQTKYEDIEYEGDTEPDPPSVDPGTGEGDNSGPTFHYRIYEDRSDPNLDMKSYSFMHQGDVMFYTMQLIDSYRGVKQ